MTNISNGYIIHIVSRVLNGNGINLTGVTNQKEEERTTGANILLLPEEAIAHFYTSPAGMYECALPRARCFAPDRAPPCAAFGSYPVKDR